MSGGQVLSSGGKRARLGNSSSPPWAWRRSRVHEPSAHSTSSAPDRRLRPNSHAARPADRLRSSQVPPRQSGGVLSGSCRRQLCGGAPSLSAVCDRCALGSPGSRMAVTPPTGNCAGHSDNIGCASRGWKTHAAAAARLAKMHADLPLRLLRQ